MSAGQFRVCVISALVFLGAARSSTADPVVIYSNFGPDPGYTLANSWDTSDEHSYMMGFQLDERAQLTSIMLPIVFGPSVTGVDVQVLGSANGMPVFGPGEIDRFTIPAPSGAQPGTVSMLTGQSTTQPLLAANTLYFLHVFPTSAPWHINWPWNNAGVTGTVVLGFGGGPTAFQGTLSAFQLNGEPGAVPEPATMLLFAAGAGVVLRRARQRRA